MNIIAWLRTPLATLIVLCSALLAQLPHAADVFRLIVVGEGLWPTLHSYTYAIALELAVLLFVVQRRNLESYLFAGVSILVNLSYYHLHGVALWTLAAAPAWLISIALPAAIAQYSHLIADATATHDTTASPPATPPVDTPHPVQLTAVTPAAPVSTDVAPDVSASATPATDVAHLVSLSNAEIARRCNVSRQTVAKWRESDTLAVKLADKLPQPATVHSNGVNHE